MKANKKIVLIMTDSQRFDMVNCYRNTGLKTPNIDKIAKEGVRFDRAYTTQPVCQAARSGIFTGQYPHTCCGWTNSMGIADNTHTLGERLSDKGIHTAFIGKWHLDGGDYFGMGKCPKGWDNNYWYDMKCYLEELTEQERLDSRNTALMAERDFSEDFTFAHRCSNRALDFLEKYHEDNFFLVVSYDEPHDPAICPPPYSTMYKDFEFPKSPNIWDTLEDKPEHQKIWGERLLGQDKEGLAIKNQYFFGCNSYADYEIGRVLDAIEKYAPDAVVIYTSDHGDMMYSHSLWAKGPVAYDEITRIPMIIKGRDIPKNIVDTNPVSHINIAPTVMEIMGFDIPKIFEGKSILKEIETGERANDYIFMEFGRYEVDHDGFGGFQPLRTVFDGRYKLTINLLTSDELYDIKNDPDEMINLINSQEYAEIRNKLHDALLDNMNNTRDPFRGYYWEMRSWRQDACKPSWDYTLMTRQREEEECYEERQLDYSTGLPMKEAVRKKGQ